MTVKLTANGLKRLEMTMRDVMDGLEDAASYMNYQSTPDVVEILSIEAPGREADSRASIISLENHKDTDAEVADIAAWLIARESRLFA